jgi:hypothetical protein
MTTYQPEVHAPEGTMANDQSYPSRLSRQSHQKQLIGGQTIADKRLSSYQKRSAEALRLEFDLLTDRLGISPLLFVTLTFPNPVPDRKACQTYHNQFQKLILEKHFCYGFTVFGRGETGRPHLHVIVVGTGAADFRSDFDFGAWHSSQAEQKLWKQSGHSNHGSGQRWRDMTARYTASASPELRAAWKLLQDASAQYGFGRINALPIENQKACGLYLASHITDGFRENNREDRRIRRVRFWGGFPRKVTQPFYRVTKGSTRWRGKLAFCADVLGFTEFDDFSKCFGPHWFIHLKGIIRRVPIPVAEASLLTSNLSLHLLTFYKRKIKEIETELLDRLLQYGGETQSTNLKDDQNQITRSVNR